MRRSTIADGDMGRVVWLLLVLSFASCASQCRNENSSNSVADSKAPGIPAKPSKLVMDESPEAPSVGPDASSAKPDAPSVEPDTTHVESGKPPREKSFYVTRTKCMRPCAVQFDAQLTEELSWEQVRDSRFVWNFDDGGSPADAEGFLAATVYESAGTYRPVVTVNGHEWKSKTITVTEPRRVACVSPAADWTNCPKGARRYGSISTAVARMGANSHILLEGNRSHGDLPSRGARNILFGAYDTEEGNPEVTSFRLSPKRGWAFQDLIVKGSARAQKKRKALFEAKQPDLLWHRVSAPSGATFLSAVFDVTGLFVVNSKIDGDAYVMFVGSEDCDRLIIKNTTLHSTVAGQHVTRVQDCDRILIQDSSFTQVGHQTALTIRGNSEWGLIQGNYANRVMSISAKNAKTDTVRRNFIWERNFVKLGWKTPKAMMVRSTHNAIYRNNVLFGHGSHTGINATGGQIQPNVNLMLVNNTYYDPLPSNKSAACTCAGADCLAKNNLGIANPKFTSMSCVPGSGAISNNWCYTASTKEWCLDPSGGSTCRNPDFISTEYGDPNFMRPRARSGHFDVGDQAVPVWNDFFDAPRTRVGVGAVRAQRP